MEYNANNYRTEENINKVLTILAEYNEYNMFFNVIQKLPRTNNSIIVSSDVLVACYLPENSSKCLKVFACEKIKPILFSNINSKEVKYGTIKEEFINSINSVDNDKEIELKCPLLKKFIDNKNKINTTKKYNIKDVFDKIKSNITNYRITC